MDAPSDAPVATGGSPAAAPAEGSAGGSGCSGWALLGVGLVGMVVLAWTTGRHLWFYSDDWNILTGYHQGRLLEPFNGHLSLLPVLVFRGVAEVFGLGSYQPFRVVGMACYLFLGVTVFIYSRRRVGQVGGALVALLVLFNASAVTNVAFPFLLNFSLPLAAMVWMWWFLDREPLKDEVAASAWLGVALASSGIGLLAMAAAGVELLWTRARLRRWLVMAPPVLLYVAWYAGFHAPVAKGKGGPGAVLEYAARMVLGGFASLVGNWKPGGVVLAVGFLVLLGLGAFRWKTFDGRVAGGLAAVATFSLLTAWTRIGIFPKIPPDEARYCWTVGAVLLLTSVQLLRNVKVPRPWSLVAAGALVATLVVNTYVLGQRLTTWDHQVRDAVTGVRTNLHTVEALGSKVPSDEVLPLSFIPVTAGDYLSMVRHFGSPVASFDPATDPLGSRDLRNRADELVVRVGGVALGPAAAQCVRALVYPPPEPVQQVVVPRGPATLGVCGFESGTEVRVSRFGDGQVVGRVGPWETADLVLPGDDLGRPWTVRVDGDASLLRP